MKSKFLASRISDFADTLSLMFIGLVFCCVPVFNYWILSEGIAHVRTPHLTAVLFGCPGLFLLFFGWTKFAKRLFWWVAALLGVEPENSEQ